MNKQHSNIELLKKFDPTNVVTASEILAEDFVWHYINPKLPEMQGDYLGLKGLTDFFAGIATRTDGSFKVNPLSITPIGDEFVVAHVKDKMVLDGKQMEIDAIVLWHIIDEKIKEAWDIPALHTATIIK